MMGAVAARSETVSSMIKTCGKENVGALVYLLLADLCNFFNVGKNMNKYQVEATSSLVIAKFQNLRVEDFKVCFDMLKAGEFGKAYDRMDGSVILDALGEYERIKQLAIDADHENKKYTEPVFNPAVASKLGEMLDSMEFEKKQLQIAEKTEQSRREYTELHEREQKWIKMFDWIYRRNPVSYSGIKMIYVKGRPVDLTRFMQIMFERGLEK